MPLHVAIVLEVARRVATLHIELKGGYRKMFTGAERAKVDTELQQCCVIEIPVEPRIRKSC